MNALASAKRWVVVGPGVILLESPTQRVPHPSRSLRRAGTTIAYATGLERKGTKVVSAASPPALAKKRKDGAPAVSEWERKNQESGATRPTTLTMNLVPWWSTNRRRPSCGFRKSPDAGCRNAQASNLAKRGAADFVAVRAKASLGQPPSLPTRTHGARRAIFELADSPSRLVARTRYETGWPFFKRESV